MNGTGIRFILLLADACEREGAVEGSMVQGEKVLGGIIGRG